MDWLNQPLTHARLLSVLSYDQETGVFRWKVSLSNRVKVGDIAGNRHSGGYLRVRIDGQLYFCHRLAVFYVTGEMPANLVDHRHGVRDDNRAAEVRPATFAQNQQNLLGPKRNNAVGLLGVSPHGSGWRAQIMVNGNRKRLGTFRSPAAASAAYLAAKRQLHPEASL